MTTPQPPSFREELISQIPALRLLMAMGYQYLTPDEALALRGGKKSNVVLEGVLEPWLKAHNQITFKGQTYPFSEANVRRAVEILVREPYDGLIPTSQRVYELLTLGTSLKQTIHGDSKSFSLHYIDWQHPENNVYHVTDEFPVEKRGSHETRRPDVVLFVNGIPLVVIECKRPDLETEEKGKAFEEAVSQMLRNQRDDEIAHLFTYAQLLLAVSVNDAFYATAATPKRFWTLWREQENGHPAEIDAAVHRLINQPLAEADKQRLYGWRKYGGWIRNYFDELESPPSIPPKRGEVSAHLRGREANLPPSGGDRGGEATVCPRPRTAPSTASCAPSGCSTWPTSSSSTTGAKRRSPATSSTLPSRRPSAASPTSTPRGCAPAASCGTPPAAASRSPW